MLLLLSAAPSLDDAREFATAIRAVYPDQMLSYNLSPSFNWYDYLHLVDLRQQYIVTLISFS